MDFTTKEIAHKIAAAACDKKAKDILLLNMENISPVTDYFIIASGSNRNQVQTMADNVEEVLGRAGYEPRQLEGYGTATWILMDYNDIIVHIFSEEDRLFYDLERIWRDGKNVDIDEFKNVDSKAE